VVEKNNCRGKTSSLLARWRSHSQETIREAQALVIAFRDVRTPWFARMWLGLVLAYAFSPIDLIPDFIPFLGALDDLLLVPLGVALAVKMVPVEVLASAREQVRGSGEGARMGALLGPFLVALIWLGALILVGFLLFRFVLRRAL
jgi:uncharacterized membrane protein YkvA (DUF1232 family)